MSSIRVQRVAGSLPAREPEIGRWLWFLEEARGRTFQRIEGLDPALVDWAAPESGNSIGSVLYHIAAIEADYLYADMLEQPFPQEVIDLFPYEVREENGRLTPMRGFDLSWYLQRVDRVRSMLLAALQAMDLADFRRARYLQEYNYDITPEWTLYHLTQHEAEHRGELAALRARAEATSS
jgi:uncharacterized damage-inducible protein DinB